MAPSLPLRALAAAALASCAAAQSYVAPQKSVISRVLPGGKQVKLPGCLDDRYCVFPVADASFIVGQVFDAYVEVQGAAPFAVPTLEVQVGGVGPFVPVGSLAAMGAAAITAPQTKSWNFAYVNGDMALFNNSAAGTIVPGCTGKANVLATCSSPAAGYWWRRLAMTAVGNHTVRLTVRNSETQSDVRLLAWNVRPPHARTARNVILFIGDGNNIPFITASRLVSRGQTAGKLNEKLHQQKLDRVGTISTNGYDSIITDSANSAAAYSCGHKSAVNAMGVYRDGDYFSTDAAAASARDDFNDPKVELITERIRREVPGMAIGVVTTSEIQDATPAAFLAHSASRYNKKEITEALWTASYGYGPVKPDVVFGGGGYYFNASYSAAGAGTGCLTTSQTGGFPAPGASRFDCFAHPRSLWAEAAAPALGNYSSVVFDRSQMKAQELKGNRMLGIWHSRNQETYLDRHLYTSNLKTSNWPVSYNATEAAAFQKPTTDQPDLLEATQTAINVLSRRGGSSGFFLMVEGAGIDKAEHPMDFERAMSEQIDFDNAIGAARAFAASPAGANTLILVTADHAQGYDAWGTVDTMAFNAVNNADGSDFADMRTYYGSPEAAKVAAIGIYGNAGFPTYVDANGDNFPDSWTTRVTLAQGKADGPAAFREDFQVATTCVGNPCARQPDVAASGSTSGSPGQPDTLGLRMQGPGPVNSQTGHTLSDVPLFGQGPGSEMIMPFMDNTDVHYIMASALGLGAGMATYPSGSAAPAGAVADVTCAAVVPTFVQHATLGLLTTSCPAGSTFCVPSSPYSIGGSTYFPVLASAASLNLQPAAASCAAPSA